LTYLFKRVKVVLSVAKSGQIKPQNAGKQATVKSQITVAANAASARPNYLVYHPEVTARTTAPDTAMGLQDVLRA
jgi:anaerobic C4-dicarboxylate transporter